MEMYNPAHLSRIDDPIWSCEQAANRFPVVYPADSLTQEGCHG